MRKGKKKRSAKNRELRRELQAESLEQKMLLTTAMLDVVSVGGGPDLMVLGRGDGGDDRFILTSAPLGNVIVDIKVDLEIGGKFDGNIDTVITQTFNVPTLEAAAASLGGKFMGFQMEGLGGNDRINAKFLKNFETTHLIGGDGNDTLVGGQASYDAYSGGAGADLVRNVDWLDLIYLNSGLPGDPAWKGEISGGTSSSGNPSRTDIDVLRFSGPNGVDYKNLDFEMIYGTNQDDKIDSSMYDGPGNRQFEGLKGKDGDSVFGVYVDARAGNDTVIGSAWNDQLEGGKGNDKLDGLAGNDLLTDSEGGDDTLLGGDGEDMLKGGDGNDRLRGGDGNDMLEGEGGDDDLRGEGGNDNLLGGDGNDTLAGGPGKDTLDGGAGSDWGDYSDAAGPIVVKLKDGIAKPDGDGSEDVIVRSGGLSTVENIIGSDFDDNIWGDDGPNKLYGGDGNDTIGGEGGNDEIKGQAGEDSLIGGAGDDTIDGGGGNDFIIGDDFVLGLSGNDNLSGGSGDDLIRGWNGNDIMAGGSGNDSMLGGSGDDMIQGDAGSDTLKGGTGMDYLEGGFNEQVRDLIFFEYNDELDRIEDFAVVGGLAHEDEFVAIKKFDTSLDPDDEDDEFFTGDEIESAAPGGFTLTERLDVRQELRNGPNYGNSKLVFTDYQEDEDLLSFGEPQ